MTWETDKACICCGIQGGGMVAIHHEATRKAFPEHEDNPLNHFPLCQRHHTMRHAIGQSAFIRKFPQYEEALKCNDWHYCEFRNKWVITQE